MFRCTCFYLAIKCSVQNCNLYLSLFPIMYFFSTFSVKIYFFYKVIENFLRSLKANKCTKEIKHFRQTF